MACQITSIVKQRHLLLWLTAVTVVYQVFYQLFMLRVLSDGDAEDQECPASMASTPRCMELRLFRDWQRAPLLHDLHVQPSSGLDDGDDEWPIDGLPMAAATVPTTPPPEARTTAAAHAEREGESTRPTEPPPPPPAAPVERTTWSPITPWARDLVELQSRMAEGLHNLPSMQHKRHDERRLSAEQEKADTRTAEHGQQHSEANYTSKPNVTELIAHGKKPSTLMKEINSLLIEMCEEPQRRYRKDCVKILAERAPSAADRHRQHEEELQALRDQQRHLQADINAVAEEHVAWEREFEQRVDAAHKELCEEPERRSRPDCIEFLAHVSAVEREKTAALHAARKVLRAAIHSNITQEAKDRAMALDQKLGMMSINRQVWETQFVHKYNAAVARFSTEAPTHAPHTTTAAHKSQAKDEMHWASVREWATNRKLRGGFRGRVTLGRRDMGSAHWAGMIPKVTCITTIKSSVVAKVQMKYFIENFKKQEYEGPSQLVIVYHHKDNEAAELVKQYADGIFIKGLPSQNDAAAFPSTLDWRYAAWSASDADVIAQWTFDTWHHPHRLSKQVRALALASRPAAVLVKAAKYGETAPAEPVLDVDTIVGEAKWMHSHWHPTLKEETAFLESSVSTDIVEVDLSVGSVAGEHGSQTLSKIHEN